VAEPEHRPRRRVLLVDDDADILDAWTMFLRDAFDLRLARNGREALALLASEPCDVIVLDLMMPVMDGAAFKHEADRRGIATPVLLVSAGHDTARQARELGAAGHLSKPVDPDVLEATIARLAG
jgi:DNA-binding NtrC family response regulator